MTITAKFDGTCKKCGNRILAGALINWEKGSGASHVECPADAPAKPKTANSFMRCCRCGQTGHTGGYPFSTNPGSGLCDDCH